MGLENEHAHAGHQKPFCIFDIETVPMPGCAQYLTEPVEAPSNYKDPVKIAAYVDDKRAKQIMDAGLDLDLCEIAAIGLAFSDGGEQVYSRDRLSETAMLNLFWLDVAGVYPGGEVVGFNVLHFDLPILQRRSLYLGVSMPKLTIDKYRHDGIVDLADLLTYGGRMKWRSLAFYARRFGLDVPEDPYAGSDISTLVAAGMWDAVAQHCRNDVATTKALAERIGVLRPAAVEART